MLTVEKFLELRSMSLECSDSLPKLVELINAEFALAIQKAYDDGGGGVKQQHLPEGCREALGLVKIGLRDWETPENRHRALDAVNKLLAAPQPAEQSSGVAQCEPEIDDGNLNNRLVNLFWNDEVYVTREGGVVGLIDGLRRVYDAGKLAALSKPAQDAPGLDERAEFEKKFQVRGYPVLRLEINEDAYLDKYTHAAWCGWKEGRAALQRPDNTELLQECLKLVEWANSNMTCSPLDGDVELYELEGRLRARLGVV